MFAGGGVFSLLAQAVTGIVSAGGVLPSGIGPGPVPLRENCQKLSPCVLVDSERALPPDMYRDPLLAANS